MSTTHRWPVLLAMLIVIFIANVDATAVNLALPQMTTTFKLKDWMVEWVINGYLISSACFFVIGGRLGDSFGKCKIFIIGLTIFILSSLLACLATNSFEIISARIIQGFSFALTYPMSIIILSQVFPKNKQGLAMALVVSASGFSIAAGPMVGGLLLHWLNWRAIFAINIPLGLIAILIPWLIVKDNPEARDNQFKDITGSLLLIGSLFYFIYTLNHLADVNTIKKIGQLSISVALLICFFHHEGRVDHPLLNKKIFSHKNYIFANIIRMFCQFIFIGLLFILPVTLQNIYAIPPLKISLLLLPLTILMGIGSIGVGKWIAQVNSLLPVTLGCLVMLIACMWLSFMPASLSNIYLEVGLSMVGIGFSLVFPGLNNIALTGHKPKLSGQAFGLYYTNATLAGAVGISISAWILKFFSQWHALKTPKLVPLASGLTPINLKYYSANMISTLHQIFHRGWSALFWFYSLLMLIALILSLWKYRPNIGPAIFCQFN
ncbi:MAG: MFS transporter [Candidatus Aquirickettsiella sp.]